MTVAAIVVAADQGEALADAAGRVAVRRIVDAAWAGGALPIIIVAHDADGRVANALAGSPATLVATGESSAAQGFAKGVRAALDAVTETSAVLLWPARMTWVDPETVTSLIEVSGASSVARRPGHAAEAGWPVLLSADVALEWLHGTSGSLEDALEGRPIEVSELGDPGSVSSRDVALDDLPAYTGPLEQLGGPPPEWGAAAADAPDPEVAAEP